MLVGGRANLVTEGLLALPAKVGAVRHQTAGASPLAQGRRALTQTQAILVTESKEEMALRDQ